VTHSFTSVDSELAPAIDGLRARRNDFAYPVGCDVGPGCLREKRDALPSPTRHVGYQNVVSKVKLRLEENPPTSRIVASPTRAVKARGDLSAKSGGCVSVRERRTRAREELAVQDLGHLVVGNGQEILVSRGLTLD
jgi:hypothetical protein